MCQPGVAKGRACWWWRLDALTTDDKEGRAADPCPLPECHEKNCGYLTQEPQKVTLNLDEWMTCLAYWMTSLTASDQKVERTQT